MRFLPYFVFTPVFPPIDESTCESKVVGIFMKLTPLCIIAATKPAKSPMTPPPNAIIVSDLSNFSDKRSSITLDAILRSLFFSPGGKIILITF